jgi:hypothetical protein
MPWLVAVMIRIAGPEVREMLRLRDLADGAANPLERQAR